MTILSQLARIVVAVALAAGPKVKGKWKEVEGYMNDHEVAALKGDPCGIDVTVTYDKESWMKLTNWASNNPYSLCADAVAGISAYCGSDEANPKKLRSLVKVVHCVYGPVSACLAMGPKILTVVVDGTAAPADLVTKTLNDKKACVTGPGK